MSSKVIPISSQPHLKTLLSSSTYVVVDFYADWCGPCKQISPIFDQLASQVAKPGRIVFAKVNVDHQRDLAAFYGVSAMPTFLILKGSKVVETIRGAGNPSALRSAILSAAADAAAGPMKQSALFSSKGQTLGSEASGNNGSGRTLGAAAGGGGGGRGQGFSLPSLNFGQLLSSPAAFAQGRGFPNMVVRFLGLYISTLFSFEPMRTAEESAFAVRRGNANVRT